MNRVQKTLRHLELIKINDRLNDIILTQGEIKVAYKNLGEFAASFANHEEYIQYVKLDKELRKYIKHLANKKRKIDNLQQNYSVKKIHLETIISVDSD
jgi:predicted nucleotidyltransferase